MPAVNTDLKIKYILKNNENISQPANQGLVESVNYFPLPTPRNIPLESVHLPSCEKI